MPGTHLFTGLASKLAGLGVVGKAGLGATLTAAGVLGAGAAGALPASADHAVRNAIESVAPVDFDDPGEPADEPFGKQVSADATGEADGENGVDGPTIAATNPGAAHRADPGDATGRGDGEATTGATGLTRANQTPAADHAPDAPPTASPTPGGPAEPGADHPGTVPPQSRADVRQPTG
jgi:hypothetical protein